MTPFLKGTMGTYNPLILLGLCGVHGSPMEPGRGVYRWLRSSAEKVDRGRAPDYLSGAFLP
jgi:hypothetical protein